MSNAMETKNILQTKTFWVNALGPVFLWLGTKYGITLDADTQTIVIFLVMSGVNIILRRFTTQPVTILPKSWTFQKNL